MQIRKTTTIEMGRIAIEAQSEEEKLQLKVSLTGPNELGFAYESLSEEDVNELVRMIRSAQNHAFGNPLQDREKARVQASLRGVRAGMKSAAARAVDNSSIQVDNPFGEESAR